MIQPATLQRISSMENAWMNFVISNPLNYSIDYYFCTFEEENNNKS